MDAFSYLSVLLSIIIGLAMTQVLQGVRGLLLQRVHVRLYLPSLLWCVVILLMATQSWWASFGLSTYRDWSFATFAMLLAQTTLLYLVAALVLPDFPAGEAVDLRAHYYREARPFFASLLAMLAASFLKDVMLDGHPPIGANLAFHILFAVAALIAIVTKARRYHEALAVVMLALLAIYIAALFNRLG